MVQRFKTAVTLWRASRTLVRPVAPTSAKSVQSLRRFSSDAKSTPGLTDVETLLGYKEDVKKMDNDELTDITTIPGFTTLIHSMPRNNSTPRNALVGKVVSDKMAKTVNVAVDRYKIVPKYRKRKKYTKKFFAHDESEVCHEGDLVMIVPCHRISRHKHFIVHEIIKRKETSEDLQEMYTV